MKEKVLEVTEICKEFSLSKARQKSLGKPKRKIVAVDNVSFDLYEGEIYCLLGSNGAGKTTTMRMLAGLIKPQRGKIIFGGKAYEHHSYEIKRQITFLTSELKLDDALTPSYLFDFFGKIYHIEDEKIKERKSFLFNRFGITQYSNEKVKNLSTGMKQKVSISVSLVHDPEIIIFDEPTNGLDIVTAREVMMFLDELRQEGKSIVLSTHILEIVEKLADRVGVMVAGKLVYTNTLEGIKKEYKTVEELFYTKYVEWGGTNE